MKATIWLVAMGYCLVLKNDPQTKAHSNKTANLAPLDSCLTNFGQIAFWNQPVGSHSLVHFIG